MSATKIKAPEIATPAYWDEACKHLIRKDRVMKRLIPQFGDACLQSRGDAFTTLARSIVGQQISVKAAQTVWDRFAGLPRAMTPPNVLKLKVDDMRAAGLSARKVEYLVDLALHFDSGAVHVGSWDGVRSPRELVAKYHVRGRADSEFEHRPVAIEHFQLPVNAESEADTEQDRSRSRTEQDRRLRRLLYAGRSQPGDQQ